MRKLLFLGFLFSIGYSCSSPDKVDLNPSSYNVELATICPSASRTSYCVTKAVYEQILTEMKNNPNQGCVYTQINTLSDGVKKGYIFSAGVGCN
ncbi:MAG: hypothetical protein H7Y10_04620 [Flavobacterium sp.]|nr:hypothetical protein [Flavobacterium sp.]